MTTTTTAPTVGAAFPKVLEALKARTRSGWDLSRAIAAEVAVGMERAKPGDYKALRAYLESAGAEDIPQSDITFRDLRAMALFWPAGSEVQGAGVSAHQVMVHNDWDHTKAGKVLAEAVKAGNGTVSVRVAEAARRKALGQKVAPKVRPSKAGATAQAEAPLPAHQVLTLQSRAMSTAMLKALSLEELTALNLQVIGLAKRIAPVLKVAEAAKARAEGKATVKVVGKSSKIRSATTGKVATVKPKQLATMRG